MELNLFQKSSIGEVKNEFSNYFHYLKIEFFYHNHSQRKGSGLQDKIPDHICLSELPAFCKEGLFYFNPSFSVTEFEQKLQNEFGLPVQIFRNSGALWIETIQTDNLSLEKQNGMGEFSNKTVRFNLHSLFL